MKKLLVLFLAMLMLVGCTSNNADSQQDDSDSKVIETLKIQFVPSRDVEDIVAVTDPLKNLIITTMATKGYEVQNVEITTSSVYEAAGEALAAGTVDLAFIPAGTYVLYHEDGVELLVAATRDGLSKDSENAADWNDGTETVGDPANQVAYYRSIAVAGPSEKGQELAAKVNAGEALTWDDVNSATFCHAASTTSSAGYIYPSIWLSELEGSNGKTVSDLEKGVQTAGYSDTASRLAAMGCDVGVGYADFRRDYQEEWTTEYGRENSVWEETNVIGVTAGIMNDTISYTTKSEIMTEDVVKALQETFIELAQTPEGKEAIAIYSHAGYTVVTDEDYDSSRTAQEIFK